MEFLSYITSGLIVTGSLVVVVIVVGGIFLFSAILFGAPYVPLGEKNIQRVKGFVRGRERVLDLGSGDGRVMRELSAENSAVHGYEINPFLVWRSRMLLRRSGLASKTRVYRRNFWRYDLGEYDTIAIYGVSYIMKRLEKKLLCELKPGAIVITVGFHFPNWEPLEKNDSVWMYKKYK